MRPARPTLTEQELEIMKVVWRLKTATVRHVYETLLERRRIAYTTVMTMMNILEQKGHLKKRYADRAYIYQPSQPQKQVIGSMVREFVDRVFNGSAEPLLAHLIEDRHLSESDLDEIRRTIKAARKKDLEIKPVAEARKPK
jgi:predicted transcriptional regulator